MTIPKVVDNPDIIPFTQDIESYQIRVNRPSEIRKHPYQLVKNTRKKKQNVSDPMTSFELRNKLSDLRQLGKQRPILVPDEFSLSKDLLLGMSIIEKVWSDANKITVRRGRDIKENIE